MTWDLRDCYLTTLTLGGAFATLEWLWKSPQTFTYTLTFDRLRDYIYIYTFTPLRDLKDLRDFWHTWETWETATLERLERLLHLRDLRDCYTWETWDLRDMRNFDSLREAWSNLTGLETKVLEWAPGLACKRKQCGSRSGIGAVVWSKFGRKLLQ